MFFTRDISEHFSFILLYGEDPRQIFGEIEIYQQNHESKRKKNKKVLRTLFLGVFCCCYELGEAEGERAFEVRERKGYVVFGSGES